MFLTIKGAKLSLRNLNDVIRTIMSEQVKMGICMQQRIDSKGLSTLNPLLISPIPDGKAQIVKFVHFRIKGGRLKVGTLENLASFLFVYYSFQCGPLEKGMANHFSILLLRTPGTE